MAAARELLEELGPSALSIRKVAERAGVSSAMVSYYFGNKEELFEAVLDEPYAELMELQQRLVEGYASFDSPAAFLADVVRQTFRYARRWRSALRLNVLIVLDRGFLHPRRQQAVQWPFLDTGAALLAPVCGLTPTEVRVLLQSAIFSLVRYALMEDAGLRRVVDVSEDTPMEEVLSTLESALPRGFLRSFNLEPTSVSL